MDTATFDPKKSFSPTEVTKLLNGTSLIPSTLLESYERLVFAILAQLDFQVLFGLEDQNFDERDGEIHLKYSGQEGPVALQDLGGADLETLYHKYHDLEQSPFFGFVRPIVFSAHIKKILLTLGITREITIHPKLALLSGQQYAQSEEANFQRATSGVGMALEIAMG